MKYGICLLSLTSVRKEADHRSELVNQLLFGEHFEITEELSEWSKIKNSYDGYEGYVHNRSFKLISESTFEKLSNIFPEVSGDLVQLIVNETEKITFPILLGSSLPFLVNGEMYIEDLKFSFEGTVNSRKKFVERKDIIETAYMYLNAPYLWGGRGPFGIDCSGFVQLVFKVNGIEMLRDAAQQAEQGETIMFIEEAEPGDVAFFDNDEGKIIHTGIILPDNKIIHASGKVRIDPIDHSGIYNSELKKYTHKLRLLKRVI